MAGWRLVQLEGDDRFLKCLEEFPEDDKFKIGGSLVMIRGGKRRAAAPTGRNATTLGQRGQGLGQQSRNRAQGGSGQQGYQQQSAAGSRPTEERQDQQEQQQQQQQQPGPSGTAASSTPLPTTGTTYKAILDLQTGPTPAEMAAFAATRRGFAFGGRGLGGRAKFVQGSGPTARPAPRRPGMGVGGKAWPPKNDTDQEGKEGQRGGENGGAREGYNDRDRTRDQEEAKRRRESGESGGPEAKGARKNGEEGNADTG